MNITLFYEDKCQKIGEEKPTNGFVAKKSQFAPSQTKKSQFHLSQTKKSQFAPSSGEKLQQTTFRARKKIEIS